MNNKKYIFRMIDDEYWYGGVVDQGINYPLNNNSEYEYDIRINESCNQVQPIMLSNKGRYIWCNDGFKVKVKKGEIEIITDGADVKLYEVGKTLKDSFKGAVKKFFPSNNMLPPEDFFVKPQYNTWIELLYNQNEADILKYAHNIIEKDMPVGIIMIDDGWSDYYGKWEFNKDKFPNPKKMVDELHNLGFKVMLWTCPFITPDTIVFRELEANGYLVKNSDGDVSIKKWWNGYSAVLDLTNPKAVEWYDNQNRSLMALYGIDGFKFDAGDAKFYSLNDVTYEKVTPNRHSELWGEFGLNYEYNEYRACYKVAGKHLVQRLADKNHSWNENGVASLIPNQLTQGIVGYQYTCPDMIGGGEYMNFLANSESLDQELFVRYAQCAALMPMMQFSAAPWRVLSDTNFKRCREASWLHVRFAPYIYDLAKEASNTGEPIVRFMEYEFPNEGMEKIKDQFMLGDKYLVAPVIESNKVERVIRLPKGVWKEVNENTIISIESSKDLIVKAPLDKLIIFERIE
ncbi:Alpha-xylosidase [uncultured Clostridium sp.]|uniref:glycoside hydrolase family 31 protein n=1 Tax=uncultured Clostridium sp. TaxID=59620 RepID=UPI000822CB5B|nr:glycoside hydrolase family 31 protein [uncultured Clostridium sp.]SCJ05652.1 Alpha-xylosidase [uncultured Clostridium sp.]